MRKRRFSQCGNLKQSYEEELALFSTDFGRFWSMAGLVLLLGVIPLVSSAYALYILNTIGIYAIAALGLNLLIGFTGQISLGHGAFFGVGAYAAAVLTTRAGIPYGAALPLAGLVTAAVGMVFGIPSVRLKHLYLTIATLAGQFIIEYVLVQWEDLTGGAEGILVGSGSIFGLPLGSDRAFFYLVFISLILMTWILSNLRRTRFGRAFVAIRDNDRAAEGMGIPLFKFKLLSFGISSFYAGYAGALFAGYMLTITPEPFNMWLSIEFIAMIIIGGLGSIPGAIFGTVFIVLLGEGLSTLTQFIMNFGATSGFSITVAPLREFIFGLSIVLFIMFEPKGLAEIWRIVRSNFRLWPFSY